MPLSPLGWALPALGAGDACSGPGTSPAVAGRPGSQLSPSVPAGVADEAAFLEACRLRGQHALPAQPAGTSARLPRPPKPAPLPKHASPAFVGEEEEDPGRHRAGSNWDPSVLAGVQRGAGAERRPPRDAAPAARGQRGQRPLLCCCVLT